MQAEAGGGIDLPALFSELEGRRETLGIDEYSLSQTTLEHVFVALAGSDAPSAAD